VLRRGSGKLNCWLGKQRGKDSSELSRLVAMERSTKLLMVLLVPRPRSACLPSANGKHFVQLAGIGLDAQAVKETSVAFKRSFGPLSYLVSAAQIASRPPPHLVIESKGAARIEGSFVLIGNGRLYGGPFPFFKRALIDDGLLDVVVFKRIGYLDIIRYLQDVIFSSSISMPDLEYFQTKRVRVSSEEEVPVEVDGELIGNCPVEFRVRERGLRVLAPI